MKACGLIVEYNPFHHGHVYHLQEAKKETGADCMIAVMSSSFLQRGEPAIIDKFHRTKAALASGIDIILELPFAYAVQSSELFAKGSVQTLHEIGVSSICFGSESGDVADFVTSYHTLKKEKKLFQQTLKDSLNKGNSFPEASKNAYQKIGLSTDTMDISQPNNILGFSYIKEMIDRSLPIDPVTIKRIKSDYHDQTINHPIASATSIRKELFTTGGISASITKTLPNETINQLIDYRQKATMWHTWENYFPLIHYRVMTMSENELAAFHGVIEGLEYRIKRTAKQVTSFQEWVTAIKTKRYTWTRLQRIFVHILTNTKKHDIENINHVPSVPYVRVLGLTEKGKDYLHDQKKKMTVPIVTQLSRNMHPILSMEEKASNAYYSILPPKVQKKLHSQELNPPIMI